ncbi:MAG: MliC family protein [Burkholderiaceae bacterium]|nr:MliC family protein [Burkholderiaceae bacterium]
MNRAMFSSASAALVVAGAAVLAGQVQATETEGAITATPSTVTTAAMTPAVTPPQPAAGEASVATPVLIAFEAGEYKCELGRSVNVREITPDRRSVSLNWGRKDYTMLAVVTQSGALRFEDNASGLVWIVIPAKAMLLDTSKGKQLANECRL